ncbi:MAG: hypothetical protein WD534_04005 [Phycisphaeraceae bacterium]
MPENMRRNVSPPAGRPAPFPSALALTLALLAGLGFGLTGAAQQVNGENADADESAITLPANIDADVITDHLQAGEFRQAQEGARAQFDRGGQLSLRLYQHGMACLGMAEETGDEADYLSAGISFMRVLVYFPRSRWAGYAEVELAHVHARIGRHDIARRLYDRARPAIDEDRDPAYHARLMRLLDELP